MNRLTLRREINPAFKVAQRLPELTGPPTIRCAGAPGHQSVLPELRPWNQTKCPAATSRREWLDAGRGELRQ